MGKIRQTMSEALKAAKVEIALSKARRDKALEKHFNAAGAALAELFNLAQGLPSSVRSYLQPPPYEAIAGGDANAMQMYAMLVCDHVKNLNSLIQSHAQFLQPYSRTCFSWPIRIAKRKPFGDDADEIIRVLQVGKDTIADDPASRFNPTSKFGKVAWELIQRIEREKTNARIVGCAFFNTPTPSWAIAARALPPFSRKASSAIREKWQTVVEQVLEEDFLDPVQAASYISLITARSHSHRRKKVFFDKVRGAFDSLWELHRQRR